MTTPRHHNKGGVSWMIILAILASIISIVFVTLEFYPPLIIFFFDVAAVLAFTLFGALWYALLKRRKRKLQLAYQQVSCHFPRRRKRRIKPVNFL